MLKATKANVCANMVLGRSFLASTSGMATAERKSCGRKARLSKEILEDEGEEDER